MGNLKIPISHSGRDPSTLEALLTNGRTDGLNWI